MNRLDGSLDPNTHIADFDYIMDNTILKKVDDILKGSLIEVTPISDPTLNDKEREKMYKELAKEKQKLVIGDPKPKIKLHQVMLMHLIQFQNRLFNSK